MRGVLRATGISAVAILNALSRLSMSANLTAAAGFKHERNIFALDLTEQQNRLLAENNLWVQDIIR